MRFLNGFGCCGDCNSDEGKFLEVKEYDGMYEIMNGEVLDLIVKLESILVDGIEVNVFCG